MSTENNDVELPDVEQSAEVLDDLYRQAFFGKLAELQVVPQTEEDAVSLLKTAARLDAVPDEQSQKQANSFFQDADSALEYVLGASEVSAQPAFETKSAAVQLAADPGLYAAALSVFAANVPDEA
jgi:hypothetical protein